MGASTLNRMVECLRRAALGGLTDHALLDAFVTRREDAAFEALLQRHGPMVLAVCRRVLGNVHDAEDAFQATFLVLIRQAASVRKRAAVGSWLYGVAYRTALKARAMNAKRRIKERQAAARPRAQAVEHDPDLDHELSALPEKYRVPVVLCELEGRPRKEVARLLGIAEGTLSSRLATARKRLAQRLGRPGFTVPGGASLPGALPALLLAATVKAAALVVAGRQTGGIVSAKAIALAEGMIRTMLVSKLKAWTAAVVLIGALGAGAGQLSYRVGAQAPTPAQTEPPKSRAGNAPRASAAALRQAEADLEAARGNLQAIQAQVALAQAQVAQREAVLTRLQQQGSKEKSPVPLQAIARRFAYRVPFETGFKEASDGNAIEILEVWGTRPRIEVGGQYLVHGKYTLRAHEAGKLYFYRTETEANSGPTPTYDLQQMSVPKGQGEFTLLHGMGGAGFLHVILTPAERYVPLANVYFGTGATVWRK
jgi:RNA polymerase sigma factor (sigma-70 family)